MMYKERYEELLSDAGGDHIEVIERMDQVIGGVLGWSYKNGHIDTVMKLADAMEIKRIAVEDYKIKDYNSVRDRYTLLKHILERIERNEDVQELTKLYREYEGCKTESEKHEVFTRFVKEII